MLGAPSCNHNRPHFTDEGPATHLPKVARKQEGSGTQGCRQEHLGNRAGRSLTNARKEHFSLYACLFQHGTKPEMELPLGGPGLRSAKTPGQLNRPGESGWVRPRLRSTGLISTVLTYTERNTFPHSRCAWKYLFKHRKAKQKEHTQVPPGNTCFPALCPRELPTVMEMLRGHRHVATEYLKRATKEQNVQLWLIFNSFIRD